MLEANGQVSSPPATSLHDKSHAWPVTRDFYALHPALSTGGQQRAGRVMRGDFNVPK